MEEEKFLAYPGQFMFFCSKLSWINANSYIWKSIYTFYNFFILTSTSSISYWNLKFKILHA